MQPEGLIQSSEEQEENLPELGRSFTAEEWAEFCYGLQMYMFTKIDEAVQIATLDLRAENARLEYELPQAWESAERAAKKADSAEAALGFWRPVGIIAGTALLAKLILYFVTK